MFKEKRKRGIGEIKRIISLPRLKKPIHNFDGEHYWGIGKASYPLSKMSAALISQDLKLREHVEYLSTLTIGFSYWRR